LWWAAVPHSTSLSILFVCICEMHFDQPHAESLYTNHNLYFQNQKMKWFRLLRCCIWKIVHFVSWIFLKMLIQQTQDSHTHFVKAHIHFLLPLKQNLKLTP
jgi:hypothetical protein